MFSERLVENLVLLCLTLPYLKEALSFLTANTSLNVHYSLLKKRIAHKMSPHSLPSPSLFPENGGALFFALFLSQGWYAVSQICLEISKPG